MNPYDMNRYKNKSKMYQNLSEVTLLGLYIYEPTGSSFFRDIDPRTPRDNREVQVHKHFGIFLRPSKNPKILFFCKKS